MTIREIIISAGYVVDSQSAKNVENSINKVKSFATKALSAIGISFSLVKINALYEEMALIQKKVENATAGMEDQAEAADLTQKAAESARASYQNMANTVSELLNSHNRLFKSVQQTADFAELMHKAFRAAGLSASDAASLSSSLTSAFATGKVSAGQFSSLMQKTPAIVTYLSQTLHITEQQVKALGTAGKITSNQLYNAFTQNADAINSSFSSVRMTITDALTSIKNQFAAWIYQIDETYHITDKVAKLMLNVFKRVKDFVERTLENVKKLSDKLGGIENLIKLIVIGIGSVKLALKGVGLFAKLAKGEGMLVKLASALKGAGTAASGAAGGLSSFFSSIGTIGSAIGSALPWILLIIALIAAFMIALDDLFNFLKGNDSVIGGLFEKIGISAEDLKAMILSILNALKYVLKSIAQVLLEVLGLVAQILEAGIVESLSFGVSILNKLMTLLKALMDKILPIIQKLIESLSKIINRVLEKVMSLLGVLLDTVMSVLDSVIKAVEPLLRILDIVLDLLDILLDVLFDLLEPVFELLDVLIELLEDILNPVLEILSELAAIIADVLGGAIKVLMSILKPLFNIIEKIFGVISKVLSWVVRNVKDVIQNVSGLISGLVRGPLGGIITALKNIVSFISGIFTGDWNKAWKSLGNIPIAIINGIISGFESLLNFFVNAINKITEGLSSLWTWIGIPAIPKIPQVSFGRINYLAKGGYVEKDSPTPAVIGDNKNEGEIVSPISMMRETMLDALTMFAKGGYGMASAQNTLAQETNNRNFVQNISINNSFKCGDTEVARTAKNAMTQSAEDITSELARVIAYAR